MKPTLLLTLSLLATLSGGCLTDYGPTSQDYYPQFYPPYFNPDSARAIEGGTGSSNVIDVMDLGDTRFCCFSDPRQ